MRACRSPGRCPLVALSQQLARIRKEVTLADGEGDAAVADLVCARGDGRGDPHCIQADVFDLGQTRGDDADPVCTRGDDAPPCSDMQKPRDVFPTDTSGILHMTTDWSSREELFH